MSRPGLSPQGGKQDQGAAWPQGGFTLVELMISMAIGLLIVLAMVTLLINVNRNNSEMSKTNRVIENGRFALQLLQADISHAGYWGGYVPQFNDLITTGVPTDFPTAVPDPCLAYATPWMAAHKTNLIGIAMQGYEIPATVASPTLSVCADRVTDPKASTDVLVVRHVETCVPGEVNCEAENVSKVYFQASFCENETAAVSPVSYVLSNSAAEFTLKKRGCTGTPPAATAGVISDKRKFISNIYYVRTYAVTPGDGVPTLMRSSFNLVSGTPAHEPALALIEGIEGFRVEYGIDNVSDNGTNIVTGADSGGIYNTANLQSALIKWADSANKTSPTNRGDGIPDGSYIRCTTAVPCTVDQLANAVAVKLYVLVRSEQKTPGYTDGKTYNLGSTSLGPFNDSYKRHLFSQTVRLTNVSSRRETP